MLKLCRVDISRSQELFKAIDNYRDKLVRELKPERIILFGSFARGDINEGSDVDLIVIADWQQDFLDRIKILMDLNDRRLPIEPIGYTPDEFKRMRKEGNPFIEEVEATGKIIY